MHPRETSDMQSKSGRFQQSMGLFSATAMVIGSMIGSAVFVVPADMSRTVGSPVLLIGAWILTAMMTVVICLSYGEYAAMLPDAGGQYVYLRESLGPLSGFLYGWTLFLVIQTGTIAAVAVAFAKFCGVFVPSIDQTRWIVHVGSGSVGLNTANLTAMGVITLLTFTATLGLKFGAVVQNIFASAKVLALLGLVSAGLFAINRTAISKNFSWHTSGSSGFFAGASLSSSHPLQLGSLFGLGGGSASVSVFTLLAVAQVGSLFSADGWNDVTFTAGEVRKPSRNLPLALGLGSGVVVLLYIACNLIYLAVLPLNGVATAHSLAERGISFASEDRVATAVLESVFSGIGAKLMAGIILISTFGCVNGMVIAGARVYYVVSCDGLGFKTIGRLDPKSGVPKNSLWLQWGWTCFLCLTGTYGQLLDYVVFAVLMFYILTLIGLFVLRRTRPHAPRPYRAIGYPVLPALYILFAFWICGVLLRYKPQYTWPGLLLVLLGIPVYLMRAKRSSAGR